MKRSDVFPQKYTKADDLQNREITVTIDRVSLEEVGPEKEQKPVLYFVEDGIKPIVVNGTNWDRLEHAFGDSDMWSGQKIQLYAELVSYQGKSVPGVRVRPIRRPPQKSPAAEMSDEIPF